MSNRSSAARHDVASMGNGNSRASAPSTLPVGTTLIVVQLTSGDRAGQNRPRRRSSSKKVDCFSGCISAGRACPDGTRR